MHWSHGHHTSTGTQAIYLSFIHQLQTFYLPSVIRHPSYAIRHVSCVIGNWSSAICHLLSAICHLLTIYLFSTHLCSIWSELDSEDLHLVSALYYKEVTVSHFRLSFKSLIVSDKMVDLSSNSNSSYELDNRSWVQIIENLSDVCQLKINGSMFTGTETDKVQKRKIL